MCPLKATTANQESWGAEWCWPQNVSWCCISYCSLSLFYTLVCMIMLKALCIFELCFLSPVISYRISCDWEEIIKAIKALWLFCWKGGSSLLGNSLNLGLPRHLFGEPWGSLSFWRVYRSGHHNLPSAIATATRPAELRSDVRQHITVFCCYLICLTASEPRGDEKDEMRKGDSRQSLWTWVIDGHNAICLSTSASLVLLFLKLHPCRSWLGVQLRGL